MPSYKPHSSESKKAAGILRTSHTVLGTECANVSNRNRQQQQQQQQQ